MRKLFISFTGSLFALATGAVTEKDLADGLFVFGCTRDNAFTPGANGEPVETVVKRYPEHHATLLAALVEAEKDGRARWRTREEGNASFTLVDELLVANGYLPLDRGDSDISDAFYNYPAVQAFSKELQVVWK